MTRTLLILSCLVGSACDLLDSNDTDPGTDIDTDTDTDTDTESGTDIDIDTDSAAQTLVGEWSGSLDQAGVVYSMEMTVDSLTVGAVSGTTNYPDLSCTGELTLTGQEGTAYSFDEVITSGTESCVDGSYAIEQVDAGTVNATWTDAANAQNTASGPLTRQ